MTKGRHLTETDRAVLKALTSRTQTLAELVRSTGHSDLAVRSSLGHLRRIDFVRARRLAIAGADALWDITVLGEDAHRLAGQLRLV